MLIYANSFPGDFILDDLNIVRDNPLVAKIDLISIFTTDYWHGKSNTGLYRPVTILSLGLNRMVLGISPVGYHAVNVMLHACVTLLLFRLIRFWNEGQSLAAAVSALLFAVHPIHTEVIDQVVGRSELLVALFLLLAFLFARRKSVFAGFLVCVFYLLAQLSKEHAISFVLLLPLVDVFFARSLRVIKERWQLYASLVVIASGWLLWTRVLLVNPLPRAPLAEAVNPLAYVDGTTQILTSLLLQWTYFIKLLLPIDLQGLYSVSDLPDFIRSIASPSGLLIILISMCVLGLIGWGWHRRWIPALCGACYLLAFLPTSNLLMPIGVAMAERLTYFPSVWFCAGFGVLAANLLMAPRLQLCAGVCLASYLMGLGWLSVRRNAEYASELRLWSAEVVNNPKDFLGWQNLGDAQSMAGNYVEAERAYQNMLAYAPEYPGGLRGVTAFYLRLGLYEKALVSAKKVYGLSRAQNDSIGMAHDGLDLAEIYLGMGDCTTALVHLKGPSLMLRDRMQYADVESAVLTCLGRYRESLEVLGRIERNGLTPLLHTRYGYNLLNLGQLTDARWHLTEAVKHPAPAATWHLLGLVCAQLMDRPAAEAALMKAVTLDPDNPGYREDLQRLRMLSE